MLALLALLAEIYTRQNTDKENTSGRADAVKRGESINKFRTKFYYRTVGRSVGRANAYAYAYASGSRTNDLSARGKRKSRGAFNEAI